MASFFRAYKWVLIPLSICIIYQLDFVSSFLIRRPILGSSLSSAVLFGAGDVVAQQAVEGKGKNHDVRRPTSSI